MKAEHNAIIERAKIGGYEPSMIAHELLVHDLVQAALQSLVDPEEMFELDGLSDQAWRERIGNAVPPAAAEAIANVMGTTLLLAAAGETFMLNSMPIWVQPVAVALSVSQQVTP